MLGFLVSGFLSSFISHGHCYLWKTNLVGLHIGSDALISLAYYSIPATLIYFVRKRKDLPFDWVFILFGAFIVLCGMTHLLAIWTVWYPIYWVSGFVKAITAVVSVATAVALVPLVPKALALPSPAQLAAANQEIAALNLRLKADNVRMSAELDILRQMQQLILPKVEELQAVERLEIAAFMEPAEEVGGDYYDVIDDNGVVTIAIGDVTGHGLESGILMVMAQTAVRALKEIQECDPVKFLNAVNSTIFQNVKRMNSEKNLTLVVLNYSDGKVSLSGQHEEAILVRANGEIERIDTMDLGLPIGLDDEISEFISQTFVELNSGDGIVLYTDGITEAKNIYKKQYGLDRLCEVISQNWAFGAEDIKQAVIEDLRSHIGTQKVFDDITLVVVKEK